MTDRGVLGLGTAHPLFEGAAPPRHNGSLEAVNERLETHPQRSGTNCATNCAGHSPLEPEIRLLSLPRRRHRRGAAR